MIYIWKIIEVLYFSERAGSYREVSVLTLIPIWILAFFCIFLGINTSLTVDVATSTVKLVLIPRKIQKKASIHIGIKVRTLTSR